MHPRAIIVGLVLLVISWGSLAAMGLLLYSPAQAAYRTQCLPPVPQDEETCARMEADLGLMSQAIIEIGLLGTIAAIVLLIGFALNEPVPRLVPPTVPRPEADSVALKWQGRRVPRDVQIAAFGIVIALVAAIPWNLLVLAISLGSYGLLLALSWRRLAPKMLDVTCLFSLGLAMFLVGYMIAGVLGTLVAMNLLAIGSGMAFVLSSGEF